MVSGGERRTRKEPKAMAWIDGCFIRKARKSHTCRACRQPIENGTEYVEYVGETNPYRSGMRYHMGECAKQRVWSDDDASTRPLRDLLRF